MVGPSAISAEGAWRHRMAKRTAVITGASRPEQVKENLAALEVLSRLTDNVMGRIEATMA